ncbi:hypothetical protein [Rhabdothermincola sediminis]|uniref:hypothetical protein n=1 Tax=Rhabdothermincola sediminis TaxID=2751370 RepID=UPI001AA05987|nr:hypothetical protein [Rhabdothermincola sediminis]
MVAVALVAVLAVAGVVTFVVLRSRVTPVDDRNDLVDVSSRLQGTGAAPAPQASPLDRADAGSGTDRQGDENGRAHGGDPVGDEDEPAVDRFRAPGQRVRHSAPAYQPTVPRKPAHLVEPSAPRVPEAPAAVESPVVPAPESVPGPVVEPVVEPAVEPTAAVMPADPQPAAPDRTAPAATEAVGVDGGEGAAEPIIVLDAGEPIVVLEDAALDPPDPAGASVDDDVDAGLDADVDEVLQALIQRLGVSEQDAAEVAAEVVEREDIDEGEVVHALSDLVERSDRRGPEPVEELILFSDQVPQRPGQLTHFANLPDLERRRVIVRVLCLLVARSEEERAGDPAPADSHDPGPRPARSWPLPVNDDLDDLPARRRLARARR